MQDYQPVDLSTYCNVGVDFYGPDNPIVADPKSAIGRQSFHGLPFEIGGAEADPARCFIGFGGGEGLHGAVTVPLGTTARQVVFAHALLESKVAEGENIGRVVAQYRVQYANGERVDLPIRERFEVSAVPPPYGGSPFLALPDQMNYLMPRYEGQWDTMGRRQAEAMQGMVRAYYVWAWENPHPAEMIASIMLEAAGRKFVVAGITLGQVDEMPLRHNGRRAVKLTLPRAEDGEKPFKLEVEVNRGVATYPHALPEQGVEEFLTDDFKGWGEAQNEKSSPAYVEVAAIPSATVTVRNDGEELGSVRWGELQARGRLYLDRPRRYHSPLLAGIVHPLCTAHPPFLLPIRRSHGRSLRASIAAARSYRSIPPHSAVHRWQIPALDPPLHPKSGLVVPLPASLAADQTGNAIPAIPPARIANGYLVRNASVVLALQIQLY